MEINSDSYRIAFHGSTRQLRAFTSHLVGKFGGNARLGDILSGSKHPERQIVKDKEWKNS